MPHSANAARLESAAGSPVQTHLSSAAFNDDGLWVVGDPHFVSYMVIPGNDTGVDDLLRRE